MKICLSTISDAFGVKHLDVLALKLLLGQANSKLEGKKEEAEQLLTDAFNGRLESLGPDHHDTVQTRFHLAKFYLQDRVKLDLAETLLQDCLLSLTKQTSSDVDEDIRFWKVMEVSLQLYLTKEKIEEAIQLLKTCEDQILKRVGPDHVDSIATTQLVANTLLVTQFLPNFLQSVTQRFFKPSQAHDVVEMSLCDDDTSHSRIEENKKLFQDLLQRSERKFGRFQFTATSSLYGMVFLDYEKGNYSSATSHLTACLYRLRILKGRWDPTFLLGKILLLYLSFCMGKSTGILVIYTSLLFMTEMVTLLICGCLVFQWFEVASVLFHSVVLSHLICKFAEIVEEKQKSPERSEAFSPSRPENNLKSGSSEKTEERRKEEEEQEEELEKQKESLENETRLFWHDQFLNNVPSFLGLLFAVYSGVYIVLEWIQQTSTVQESPLRVLVMSKDPSSIM